MYYDNRTTKPANIDLLNDRLTRRDTIQGPRVGDYLKYTGKDGSQKYTRFTHAWTGIDGFPDKIQTGGGQYGQFYMHFSGALDYSGGLDSGILIQDLIPTDETRPGKVWFFDEDHARAHGGVDYMIPCRVFTHKPDADLSGVEC